MPKKYYYNESFRKKKVGEWVLVAKNLKKKESHVN